MFMEKYYIYYKNESNCEFFQKHGDYYYLHTKTPQGEVIDTTRPIKLNDKSKKVIIRDWEDKIIGFECDNVIFGSFNN